MPPDECTLAGLKAGCICKGIKLIRLIEAIDNGGKSYWLATIIFFYFSIISIYQS